MPRKDWDLSLKLALATPESPFFCDKIGASFLYPAIGNSLWHTRDKDTPDNVKFRWHYTNKPQETSNWDMNWCVGGTRPVRHTDEDGHYSDWCDARSLFRKLGSFCRNGNPDFGDEIRLDTVEPKSLHWRTAIPEAVGADQRRLQELNYDADAIGRATIIRGCGLMLDKAGKALGMDDFKQIPGWHKSPMRRLMKKRYNHFMRRNLVPYGNYKTPAGAEVFLYDDDGNMNQWAFATPGLQWEPNFFARCYVMPFDQLCDTFFTQTISNGRTGGLEKF